MHRVLSFVIALALVALSCSNSDADQAASSVPLGPTEAAVTGTAQVGDSSATPTAEPTKQPISVAADPADVGEESDPAPDLLMLLPDAERWVVVDDWSASGDARPVTGIHSSLQLDVAPLDDDGVPQLGRRVSLSYRVGPIENLDRQWGDASSMGEPVDFVVEGGVGRSVRNPERGFAMALVWNSGTFVSVQAQAQDSDVDVTELAQSLTPVDEVTWDAARAGAADQRLIAIEAAMVNVEPVAAIDEPLPHWILPEPWQLQWVTDMTIWTSEQKTQALAFAESYRPPSLDDRPQPETMVWRYGFAATPEAAARQFVPHVTVHVSVFDVAPDAFYPTNYEAVSALGLEGVISPVDGDSSVRVELGSGAVRAFVSTANFGEDDTREFLGAIEFASDDPLDGFVVSDPRFQLIELAEWEQRPPSWHALWKNADGGPDVSVSVWRLTVPELRMWMLGRGVGVDIPDDVWETVAEDGVVDFGRGTTYDVSTGLLMALRGIALDDLIPIELDDWITLVEPVNADPIRPR